MIQEERQLLIERQLEKSNRFLLQADEINHTTFMKKDFIKLLAVSVLFIATLSGCNDPKPKPKNENFSVGVIVMNEGNWHANNASLTAYDLTRKETVADYFAEKNGRGLGDVANDALIYGSKLYVVVNISSLVEVIDTATGKSLQQISLFNEKGIAREPRRVCSHNGKIYVCCFDSTVLRIDTALLQVEAMGKAGLNPDGIAASDGKLYVSNSGGLNYPDYGTTVSVMDPNSLTVLKTIPVRINPVKSSADGLHHVWVMSWGDYDTQKACIQCIDTQTDSVVATFDESVSDFDIHNNIVYLLCSDYSDPWLACKSIDAISFRMETLFEKTSLTTPYNLNIRPSDGSIWICDALDYSSFGNVYCFDRQGNELHRFEAGNCPGHIVFYRSKK